MSCSINGRNKLAEKDYPAGHAKIFLQKRNLAG